MDGFTQPTITPTFLPSIPSNNEQYNFKKLSKTTIFLSSLTVIIIYICYLIIGVFLIGGGLSDAISNPQKTLLIAGVVLLLCFFSLILLILADWTNLARIKKTSLLGSNKELLLILPYTILSYIILIIFPFFALMSPLLPLIFLLLMFGFPLLAVFAIPIILIYYNLKNLPQIAFKETENKLF